MVSILHPSSLLIPTTILQGRQQHPIFTHLITEALKNNQQGQPGSQKVAELRSESKSTQLSLKTPY